MSKLDALRAMREASVTKPAVTKPRVTKPMTAEQRAQFSETLRTVVVAKSKGGRPKIGAAPMTGAERVRRLRAKRKAKA